MRFGSGRARCVGVGVYAAAVAVICVLTGVALLKSTEVLLQAAMRADYPDLHAGVRPGAVALHQGGRGFVTLSQDDWVERIQRREYWEGRGGVGSGPSRPNGVKTSAPQEKPSKLGRTADPSQIQPVSAREASRGSLSGADWDGNYRTMCVRLCDGYFFPVSFSTTEDNFERDQVRCQASCGSPARLFVYKNPGEEIDEMKDLDGAPYGRLKTAFLFRQKYDGACKCTPHPWEPQALERHRLYALEAAGKKGDKMAAKAASELKSKIATEVGRQKHQKNSGKVQSADDGLSRTGIEGTLSPARSKKGKKKHPNPTADATSSRPDGIRTDDQMRLGAARPSGRIRSSGGKPIRADLGARNSRRPAWQTTVFERH